MFHASHDLIAYAADTRPWREIFPYFGTAIATETRRAATGNTDAVEDEGAGPKDIAQ